MRSSFHGVEILLEYRDLNIVEYIKKTVETTSSRGETGARSRVSVLYVLPLVTGTTGDRDPAEKVYDLLEALRQRVDGDTGEVIKIAIADGVDKKYIRKLVEAVFWGKEYKVRIYVGGNRLTKQRLRAVKMGQTSEKLIMKMGRNYADTLKKVKQTVDIQQLGVKIKSARKTVREDLLLEVKGEGKEQAAMVEGTIEGTGTEAKVEYTKRTETVYIFGVEPDIGEEGVVKAVLEQVPGACREEVKVVSCKVVQEGNLTAMLATGNKFLAREMVKRGEMKKGWTVCRVRGRTIIDRYYKCLCFGHRTWTCKGPDKSKSCYNCDQHGHVGRDCTNLSFCWGFNEEGHRADQMRSPIFRSLVNDKNKNVA